MTAAFVLSNKGFRFAIRHNSLHHANAQLLHFAVIWTAVLCPLAAVCSAVYSGAYSQQRGYTFKEPHQALGVLRDLSESSIEIV